MLGVKKWLGMPRCYFVYTGDFILNSYLELEIGRGNGTELVTPKAQGFLSQRSDYSQSCSQAHRQMKTQIKSNRSTARPSMFSWSIQTHMLAAPSGKRRERLEQK